MSIPQAPPDLQLITVIEKLAEFVAKNGSEFERKVRGKLTTTKRFYSKENCFFGFFRRE
jgi:Surp module